MPSLHRLVHSRSTTHIFGVSLITETPKIIEAGSIPLKSMYLFNTSDYEKLLALYEGSLCWHCGNREARCCHVMNDPDVRFFPPRK